MTYLEKATRSALIVNSNGEATRLKRLPFMQSSFNEAWLQELIENNSFLLPSGEISPKYSQLVCIGREVPVGSGETQGYIDNLYITPTGEIVIVETKLFRNQAVRRTVIAQIIDYAKDVQKWDASRLNEIASDYYYRKIGQSCNLIDVMARNGYLSLSDEGELIDRLNANLQSASFLLMIVGDGIRTGVHQLVDFLNDNASMAFDLALVELEIYQHNEDTIVIPNVSLKTSLVERYTISS